MKITVDHLVLESIRPAKMRRACPLMFIHGAGGTSRFWKNYLPYFADRGWEVYAVNLRGHYPSQREEALAQVTLEDYLEDVNKIILRLEIKCCALIGHSLGGLIAQKTAENNDSIKALAVIASAPPLGVAVEVNHDLPYSGTIIKTMWGMMNLKPVKPTFAMAQQTVLNNIAPDERSKVFDMFVAESLVVGYQVTQGYPVYPLRIKCPKLVMGCVQDVVTPVLMQRGIADFLQADYIEYEQYAHLPMLEDGWEKSAADLANWLDQKVESPGAVKDSKS